MYKLHLILKYLRKRRIAWVSLIAVTLCTTMVMVVMSVMGGWLEMFKERFRGQAGDVIVMGQSLTGFPHYDEMMVRINELPGVSGSTPVLETFGLVNVNNTIRKGVEVKGLRTQDVVGVLKWRESLFLEGERLAGVAAAEPGSDVRPGRLSLPPDFYDRGKLAELSRRGFVGFDLPLRPEAYEMVLPEAAEMGVDVAAYPGMIVGIGVLGETKNSEGEYERGAGLGGFWAKLTTLAVDPYNPKPDLQGDKAERNYWVTDDSVTGVFQFDNNAVYVPFDVLQRDLDMAADPQTNRPARTHQIHVAVAPGYDENLVRDQVAAVVQEVRTAREIGPKFPTNVLTWQDLRGEFIKAVENETVLVTFLLGIISVVSVFQIFCIFYMIVTEKTKDIGILKSVGGSSAGIAGIFLGYAAAIGLVGSLAGFGLSWLIMRYINQIHDGIAYVTERELFDPAVYAFDRLPTEINFTHAGVIVVVAIVSCLVGAVVPALAAARKDPVASLRAE
ncbi:MAG: ABC transporter permease [Phycisphaerae bacterium]